MTLMVKFIAAFAAVGLVLSLIFGFLGGNRWTAVLITSLFCAVLSAALGGGVYKVLELRVPEFLSLFSGEESGGLFQAGTEFENEGDLEEADVLGGEGLSPEPALAGRGSRDKDSALDEHFKTTTFGDHILVNKIKIRNEPKLMARAIRNMLAKDED